MTRRFWNAGTCGLLGMLFGAGTLEGCGSDLPPMTISRIQRHADSSACDMFLCVTDIIQNGITVAGITACAGATGALGAAGCTLAISSISITTAQMIHGRGICEGCFNNSVYECTNGRPEAYGLSGIEPINLKAPAPGNPVYAYCSSGSAGAEQYKGNCGDRASVYDIAACCASYCNVSNPYDPPPPPPATDGGGGGGSGGTTISADTFVGTNGTGGDSWQITCSNDGSIHYCDSCTEGQAYAVGWQVCPAAI